MEQSYNIWLLLALALVAGTAIGFFISRRVPTRTPDRTQQLLDELQERFDNYQTDVISHFNTTAALVGKLTQSYQDVQQHLAEGASQLALDELARQRLLRLFELRDRILVQLAAIQGVVVGQAEPTG